MNGSWRTYTDYSEGTAVLPARKSATMSYEEPGSGAMA